MNLSTPASSTSLQFLRNSSSIRAGYLDTSSKPLGNLQAQTQTLRRPDVYWFMRLRPDDSYLCQSGTDNVLEFEQVRKEENALTCQPHRSHHRFQYSQLLSHA